MAEYLAQPDAPDDGEYHPFEVTLEQLEFLVRLYEIEPHTGKRVKHRAVYSGPRGTGKSPFAAGIGIAEGLFDVVPDGWDADGQPVGRPWSDLLIPRVAFAAVSEDQSKYSWDAALDMIRNGRVLDEFDVEPLDSQINLPRGYMSQITSSARTAKGMRAVMALLDQTEEWVPGNGGVRLAQVLRNNATKIGGLTLEMPNAFTPGERSVAERSAKTYIDMIEGRLRELPGGGSLRSLLYQHREAPPETDVTNYESLVHGLRIAYGDASAHPDGCLIHDPPCPPGWVDIDRVVADMWDTANDPNQMRRDFLNQVTHATDAWLAQHEIRAVIADGEGDRPEPKTLAPRETITLGFDGSEGRKESLDDNGNQKRNYGIADSTVLIAYSLKQKHFFPIGIWEQPDGPAGVGWRPPEVEIEQAVKDAFKRYNVVGFAADPSAGWAGSVKTWESRYGRRLKGKLTRDEPIKWRQKDIAATTEAFDQLETEILNRDVTIDGHPRLVAHMINARRDPRRSGYVLKKADDNQDYGKIDACYGMAFAYAVALKAIGKGATGSSSRSRRPKRLR